MRIHCLIYYFKWHHPFLLPHNQISLSISAMKNAWKSQRSLRHILSLSRSLMAQQMNQSCEPPTKPQTQTVKLTLSPFSPAPSHSSVLQGHWALHSFSSNSVVFILIIMYYIFFLAILGKEKNVFHSCLHYWFTTKRHCTWGDYFLKRVFVGWRLWKLGGTQMYFEVFVRIFFPVAWILRPLHVGDFPRHRQHI